MRLDKHRARGRFLLGLGFAGMLVAPVFAFEVTQMGLTLAPTYQPAEWQVGERWVQLRNGGETIETTLVSET